MREVGTATIRSVSPHLIFRKPAVKSELVMEVITPTEGRKMRAFYGRDGDSGQWRGQVEDIGDVNDAGVSPYAYIRVLDDEAVSLRDVTEMTEGMADRYGGAVERDHKDFDEGNLYSRLNTRLEELQYNANEMKRDFEAGMRMFFGANWPEVAKELFPQGAPRL